MCWFQSCQMVALCPTLPFITVCLRVYVDSSRDGEDEEDLGPEDTSNSRLSECVQCVQCVQCMLCE